MTTKTDPARLAEIMRSMRVTAQEIRDAGSYGGSREEIADLLEVAAQTLRWKPNGEKDGSAAWRIADAGLLLRRLNADAKWLDEPTGRGAILPKRV